MITESAAHRVRHRHVGHQSGAKKTLLPGKGSINELVHNHEHAWPQILAQGTDRTDGDQVGHAGALQDINVGPVVDLGGRDPVPASMARQKYYRLPVQLTKQEFVRGFAKRRNHTLPMLPTQPFNGVNTAATNNAEHGRLNTTRHTYFLSRNSRRKILPTGVFGNSVRNSMTLGCL